MQRTFARRPIGAVVIAAAMLTPAALARDEATIGTVELSGQIREQPDPFGWLSGDSSRTLRSIVDQFDEIADRDDLDGIVLRLKDTALNRAQIQEIGQALQRVRESGKKVHLFTEIAQTQELLVGSYTDEIILQTGSLVSLPGMYVEEMFLADTLAWIGIEANLIQIGDYKGAKEMFANSVPSKEWEQNINQLLDSLYANMRAEIMNGRGMSEAQLDRAMAEGWACYGEQAVKLGLVDAVVDLSALSDHLEGEYDAEIAWEELKPEGGGFELDFDSDNPFAFFNDYMKFIKDLVEGPDHTPQKPTIAIVHIEGTIIDGDSKPAGMFGGGSVGSRTIRNTLEDIIAEDLIDGVIVRINSPGGSAIASDVIWQGLRRVAEQKPVWVSVGSMAASGGYYIAVSGDKIYVDESSIVGSIGVVGGKFARGGLYKKLKINVVEHARGPVASLNSSSRPWNEQEAAMVREKMAEIYDLFTRRVTAGRKGIDLSKTAEGRLFTGNKAIGLKMADEIGTLDDAINDMADALGMIDFDVMDYPGPEGLDKMLEQMFGNFVVAPGVSQQKSNLLAEALREVVGPQAWPAVRDSLNAMVLFRDEPILLVMPSAIVIH
jgi:protease-4